MSDSDQTEKLSMISPGTADVESQNTPENGTLKRFRNGFLKKGFYRSLACISIICGCSWIGVYALINSVKAEHIRDNRRFLYKAKKLSIISLVTCVSIMILIPVSLLVISYLITLQDS